MLALIQHESLCPSTIALIILVVIWAVDDVISFMIMRSRFKQFDRFERRLDTAYNITWKLVQQIHGDLKKVYPEMDISTDFTPPDDYNDEQQP